MAIDDPTAFNNEVTFISGITTPVAGPPAVPSVIAGVSFRTWLGDNPATYSQFSSFTRKYGSTTIGTAGGVSYFFDTASNWTEAEKAGWVSGMALWSAEANVGFVPAATAASANFTIQRNVSEDASASAGANATSTPLGAGTTGTPGTGRVLTMDTRDIEGWGSPGNGLRSRNGFTFGTVNHELGHILGLGHGGAYNGDGGRPAFTKYDNLQWALMSYIRPSATDANWTVNGVDFFPTTPMMADIAAIQRLYGKPAAGPLASGGQTFGFNSNVGGPAGRYFDFTQNTQPVITIWDGGPNNTLDFSGFTTPTKMDLTPGNFSSCAGLTNNIGITPDTVIKTAMGGSGPDQIIGNGLGQNQLFGGAGNNWLGVSGNANALVNGNDGGYIGATGNGNTLVGGTGNDQLYVAAGSANALYGMAGNDWVGSNGDSNQLFGGDGNDYLGATGTNNAISNGTGNATLFANGTSNTLFGGSGNDWIGVSGNANRLVGGAGSNYMAATGSRNTLDPGGGGTDTLVAAANLHDNDIFVFHPGYGNVTIQNFTPQVGDVINIAGFGITTAAGFAPFESTSADGSIVLNLSSATRLTLQGIPGGLQDNWFNFNA
jgi:serralysin